MRFATASGMTNSVALILARSPAFAMSSTVSRVICSSMYRAKRKAESEYGQQGGDFRYSGAA